MSIDNQLIKCPKCKGSSLTLNGFVNISKSLTTQPSSHSNRKSVREFKCKNCLNKFTE